jgi:hypothetical protein
MFAAFWILVLGGEHLHQLIDCQLQMICCAHGVSRKNQTGKYFEKSRTTEESFQNRIIFSKSFRKLSSLVSFFEHKYLARQKKHRVIVINVIAVKRTAVRSISLIYIYIYISILVIIMLRGSWVQNHGPVTAYPEVFRGFLRSIQENVIVPVKRPRLLSSISFQTHYSMVVLSCPSYTDGASDSVVKYE